MTDSRDSRLRTCIAQEAARILLDEGVEDYQFAKLKAADRLNAGNRQLLPGNREIERAVLEHQRLFFTRCYRDHVSSLRRAAIAAMRLLSQFEPRLTGPVLSGTAGEHSDIDLHVFADSAEEVLFVLMDAGIAYRSFERRLRHGADARHYPGLRFAGDDCHVEAVVLPADMLKRPPTSPIDGKPMRRATIRQVEALLEASTGNDNTGGQDQSA
ncbi:MAG: hypothetical protein ACREVE_11270 [Gammaproteobacteria bacterium]